MSTLTAEEDSDDDDDDESENDNSNHDEDADAPPLFSSLPNLHPSSLHALEHKLKLSRMTEIQHKTFEAASSGRDVLGRARTGTGKTLAFLLPAIENALRSGRVPGPYEPAPHGGGGSSDNDGMGEETQQRMRGGIAALVLSPTRELAMQIHSQAQVLAASHANGLNSDHDGKEAGKRHRMSSQVMYGGSSRNVDLRRLEENLPFVLVATPGRLIDHMENSYVRGTPFAEIVGNVSVIVLDEADRCLDMGFRKDMEYILGMRGHFQELAVQRGQRELAAERSSQTLLFSATIPKDLRSIMASHMRPDYLTVDCVRDVDPATHTNEKVDQSFVTLPAPTNAADGGRWISGLVDLLEDISHIQNPDDYKVVVFFPTTNACQFFSHIFNRIYRIPVMEIHSKKTQKNRTVTSDRFRKFRKGILFTTDVSARGVDYPDVTHVIQYGSAEGRETYIHRLGRTGRAGKKGRGILVLGAESEQHKFVYGELKGLDVRQDDRLQALVEGNVVAEEGYGGGGVKGAMRRKEINEERLQKIQRGIGEGSDQNLQDMASHMYRSLLGYNATKIQNLGMDRFEMVQYVNSIAEQLGFRRDGLPRISYKVAETLRLQGIPGVNVGGDRGGDRGGGGRFGNSNRRGGSSGRRTGRYGDEYNRSGGRGGGRGGNDYDDMDGRRGRGRGGYSNYDDMSDGRGQGRGGYDNDNDMGYDRSRGNSRSNWRPSKQRQGFSNERWESY